MTTAQGNALVVKHIYDHVLRSVAMTLTK